MRAQHVFSIPPGASFLATFADALLTGRIVTGFPNLDDPFALSRARIFVPTRRAARALANELAARLDKPAILLPEIVPLGAMDDSETAALFDVDSPLLDGAASVSEIERRLVLMKLILSWGQALRNAICSVDASGKVLTDPDEAMLVTNSPAQAFVLARDLGGLIDELVIQNIDPAKFENLMPERFDQYWGITLEFLKIAFKQWPAHLEERNLQDRAHKQVDLVDYEITRLVENKAQGPQIVIGSTGTNAATARLISAISALPQGAVVLPGLDMTMDEAAWNAIGGGTDEGFASSPAGGHPQAALRKLLSVMEISRADVTEIGMAPKPVAARLDLLREALRPAETTDAWLAWREQKGNEAIAQALQTVTLIEAADERMEALAIAVALREALETPERTAALVTPDRNLALRVRAELQRWNVEVDDSGGDALAGEPAGLLADIVVKCAGREAGSADVIALLDHAHVRLGYVSEEYGRLRGLAEIAALRGCFWSIDAPEPALAAAQVAASDIHAHRSKKALHPDDWIRLGEFFNALKSALHPLRRLSGEQPLPVWIEAHVQALELLRRRHESDATIAAGDDESALRLLFESFAVAPASGVKFGLDSYAALFANLLRETKVRGLRHSHPRIKILGLLEARLIKADLMILGGLDESIWPPAARSDAFLNRPMRASLGLSLPERRIGQTAHDFVEAMGTDDVILTRSAKREGAPTVPSRFLQRMAALAGEPWGVCKKRGERFIKYAGMLDDAGGLSPVSRPAPKPALELRPTGLSVTQIETWRRDPYSIFAQHILKLEPLEEPDAEEGAAEFGTRLHDVLAEFQKLYPEGGLPADADEKLIALAEKCLAAQLQDADFRAFKWPRVHSFLCRFAAWDNERRAGASKIFVEQSGKMPIGLDDGSTFTLRCRADRFEMTLDGAVTIIDYKSGNIPTQKQVNSGLVPQLTLEAAMVKAGAFDIFAKGTAIADALYVPIGKDEDIVAKPATGDKQNIEDAAGKHLKGLIELATQFRNADTPYLPRPFPQFANKYALYDHLARVKEWAPNTQGDDG